jgi:phosphotransferase system HPr-like phosphotransfer protein
MPLKYIKIKSIMNHMIAIVSDNGNVKQIINCEDANDALKKMDQFIKDGLKFILYDAKVIVDRS